MTKTFICWDFLRKIYKLKKHFFKSYFILHGDHIFDSKKDKLLKERIAHNHGRQTHPSNGGKRGKIATCVVCFGWVGALTLHEANNMHVSSVMLNGWWVLASTHDTEREKSVTPPPTQSTLAFVDEKKNAQKICQRRRKAFFHFIHSCFSPFFSCGWAPHVKSCDFCANLVCNFLLFSFFFFACWYGCVIILMTGYLWNGRIFFFLVRGRRNNAILFFNGLITLPVGGGR